MVGWLAVGARVGAKRMLADRRGTSAVEFGMVATPFFALILGGLQVSVIFFTGQALETFTETSGRGILVGTTQAQGFNQAQFKANLCASLPRTFKCSNLFVDVTTVGSFASAGSNGGLQVPTLTFDNQGNVTNTWNYDLGNPGDIVVLRLMYQLPALVAPMGVSFSNQTNGSRLLMATAVFQNEQTN